MKLIQKSALLASLCAALLAASAEPSHASSRWTHEASSDRAYASSCGRFRGERSCLAVFCAADGRMQIGLTGFDAAAGQTRSGEILALRRSTSGDFIRESQSPLGAPIWRFRQGADQGLRTRLMRSNRTIIRWDGPQSEIYFTLGGSRFAITQTEKACARLARNAPDKPQRSEELPKPLASKPKQTPLARSTRTALKTYRRQMLGRWGTRELCRTGAGWSFRRNAFSTPTGMKCSHVAAQQGKPPAVKVIGQKCTRNGAQRGDSTYELSRIGANLLLTRIAGPRTATFILNRCR